MNVNFLDVFLYKDQEISHHFWSDVFSKKSLKIARQKQNNGNIINF